MTIMILTTSTGTCVYVQDVEETYLQLGFLGFLPILVALEKNVGMFPLIRNRQSIIVHLNPQMLSIKKLDSSKQKVLNEMQT